MPDRRSIKQWAAMFDADGSQLTIPEAQLLASIAMADRLLEIRDSLQDMQCRLTRIEMFLAETVPGYDEQTKHLARALVEAG